MDAEEIHSHPGFNEVNEEYKKYSDLKIATEDLGEEQTCAARHTVKSSQSHTLFFLSTKSKS